jgi:hypothetical protein
MLLKEQFFKKQTVGAQYWLMGRVSCFNNFPNLIQSDRIPAVAYSTPGSRLKMLRTKQILKKKIENRSVIAQTGFEDVD